MEKKPQDKLQRLPVIAEAVSKLLLPVVIAGVGLLFNYIQHRADVEQRKADRVTTFIKHLASENSEEKALALRVMSVLIDEGQLPSELGPALIISAADTDKRIAQLSQKSITKLARRDTSFRQEILQTAKQSDAYAIILPARIYIHISKEAEREKATSLKKLFQDNGFVVSELERVDEAPAGQGIQVRYYRDQEEPEVERIAQLLVGAGLDVEKKNMKGTVSLDKVRPRTFEVWFEKDFGQDEDNRLSIK